MRGEDIPVHQLMNERARITPACAGKTKWWTVRRCCSRDHPRMRGEDTGDRRQYA